MADQRGDVGLGQCERVHASADRQRHQQNRIAERILLGPRAEARGQIQEFLGELPDGVQRHVRHRSILRRFVRCSKNSLDETVLMKFSADFWLFSSHFGNVPPYSRPCHYALSSLIVRRNILWQGEGKGDEVGQEHRFRDRTPGGTEGQLGSARPGRRRRRCTRLPHHLGAEHQGRRAEPRRAAGHRDPAHRRAGEQGSRLHGPDADDRERRPAEPLPVAVQFDRLRRCQHHLSCATWSGGTSCRRSRSAR